ncbi:MAG: hypothetical protein Q8M35_07630, partial [Pseudohongiella sp.]|nr:hypothetical protein [Pseudohongiella sp.]
RCERVTEMLTTAGVADSNIGANEGIALLVFALICAVNATGVNTATSTKPTPMATRRKRLPCCTEVEKLEFAIIAILHRVKVCY